MAAPLVGLSLEAHYIAVQKYYMLASVALLFYDLATTLDIEIERVWSGKFRPFTVLWTLNRWFPVLGYTFVIWLAHNTSISTDRCRKFVMLVPSMQVISYTIIALVVILRTWAIYCQRMWPVTLLGSVYVMALSVQTYVIATSTTNISLPPGVKGCLLGATPESSFRFLFFWIVALVFDTLLFGLTLFKTLSLRHSGANSTLTSLLIRDGIIYFLVMFLANVMNVILFLTAPPQLKGMNIYFSHIITTIMISHIMLNLRMHSQRHSAVPPAGNLVKPKLGMRWSQVPSSMGIRSAGMTTVMATPVTPTAPHVHYSQQSRSMLTETLERFGAPMAGSGGVFNGSYQEISDLPMYSLGDPRPSPGFLGQDPPSIALVPLDQALTR